jgi:competence protein ComGD
MNRQGFTLLELLLVLSILMTMTAIILPIGNKWVRTSVEDDAVQSIIATIYSLQSYSMAHGKMTQLHFPSSGTIYVASVPGEIEFSRQAFPNGMRVISNSSTLSSILFLPNGNVLEVGTLIIRRSSDTVQLKIQMERGRVIIHE